MPHTVAASMLLFSLTLLALPVTLSGTSLPPLPGDPFCRPGN